MTETITSDLLKIISIVSKNINKMGEVSEAIDSHITHESTRTELKDLLYLSIAENLSTAGKKSIIDIVKKLTVIMPG